MPRLPEFLPTPLEALVNEEAPSSELGLLLADSESFLPQDIALLKRGFAGAELSEEEAAAFKDLVEFWWAERYPQAQTVSDRQEIIYASSPVSLDARKKRKELSIEIVGALLSGNVEENSELYARAAAEYGNEGAAALFELPSLFRANSQLLKLRARLQRAEEHAASSSEIRAIREEIYTTIIDTTEYQFLLTHHIKNNFNEHNEQKAKEFWSSAAMIAEAYQQKDQFEGMKRGIISQVATQHIFEALGRNATQSHPKVDGLNSIDLVMGNSMIQVKTSRDTLIVKKMDPDDDIAFPGVQFDDENGERNYFQGRHAEELFKFKTKVRNYEQKINKKLNACYFVLPSDPKFVNQDTGRPTDELVEQSRVKLGYRKRPALAA